MSALSIVSQVRDGNRSASSIGENVDGWIEEEGLLRLCMVAGKNSVGEGEQGARGVRSRDI